MLLQQVRWKNKINNQKKISYLSNISPEYHKHASLIMTLIRAFPGFKQREWIMNIFWMEDYIIMWKKPLERVKQDIKRLFRKPRLSEGRWPRPASAGGLRSELLGWWSWTQPTHFSLMPLAVLMWRRIEVQTLDGVLHQRYESNCFLGCARLLF